MTTLEPASMMVHLPIALRIATQADLPKMEWYGQYAHHRQLFQRAFREQQQGRRRILLADCNNFPIGHIFILLKNGNGAIGEGSHHAYFYSLRVMEMFRNQGIGTRLIQEAETLVKDQGFMQATIAVAKDNRSALRLYQRLGYQIFAEDSGRWSYVDHHGQTQQVNEPCWFLEKKFG